MKYTLMHSDINWKPLHPNNSRYNSPCGRYALLFKKGATGINAIKLTIEYQLEEMEPMVSAFNGHIEAYNLFLMEYDNVQGPLHYPGTNKCYSGSDTLFDKRSYTFFSLNINNYGEFIRSYKTLSDAENGALKKCNDCGYLESTIINRFKRPVYRKLYGAGTTQ